MVRLNTGNAASGALSGAATGATLGSVIPGVGTALGGGLGGLLGGLGGLFSSTQGKKVPTLNKRQRDLFKQYSSGIQNKGPLADLFNFDAGAARENFNQTYAQPAYQQFQEEIVPQIMGSFRGRNLGSSSYAGSALAKAGTQVQNNLNNQLSSMLYSGQQDALKRRLDALQNILSMQTFAQQQRQPNALESVIGGMSPNIGQMLGNQFANKFLAPGYQTPGGNMAMNGANAAFFGGF